MVENQHDPFALDENFEKRARLLLNTKKFQSWLKANWENIPVLEDFGGFLYVVNKNGVFMEIYRAVRNKSVQQAFYSDGRNSYNSTKYFRGAFLVRE